jgi:hypothetical protein
MGKPKPSLKRESDWAIKDILHRSHSISREVSGFSLPFFQFQLVHQIDHAEPHPPWTTLQLSRSAFQPPDAKGHCRI